MWGQWFYPRKFATANNYPVEKSERGGKRFSDIPDIDARLDEYEILKWAVEVREVYNYVNNFQ